MPQTNGTRARAEEVTPREMANTKDSKRTSNTITPSLPTQYNSQPMKFKSRTSNHLPTPTSNGLRHRKIDGANSLPPGDWKSKRIKKYKHCKNPNGSSDPGSTRKTPRGRATASVITDRGNTRRERGEENRKRREMEGRQRVQASAVLAHT